MQGGAQQKKFADRLRPRSSTIHASQQPATRCALDVAAKICSAYEAKGLAALITHHHTFAYAGWREEHIEALGGGDSLGGAVALDALEAYGAKVSVEREGGGGGVVCVMFLPSLTTTCARSPLLSGFFLSSRSALLYSINFQAQFRRADFELAPYIWRLIVLVSSDPPPHFVRSLLKDMTRPIQNLGGAFLVVAGRTTKALTRLEDPPTMAALRALVPRPKCDDNAAPAVGGAVPKMVLPAPAAVAAPKVVKPHLLPTPGAPAAASASATAFTPAAVAQHGGAPTAFSPLPNGAIPPPPQTTPPPNVPTTTTKVTPPVGSSATTPSVASKSSAALFGWGGADLKTATTKAKAAPLGAAFGSMATLAKPEGGGAAAPAFSSMSFSTGAGKTKSKIKAKSVTNFKTAADMNVLSGAASLFGGADFKTAATKAKPAPLGAAFGTMATLTKPDGGGAAAPAFSPMSFSTGAGKTKSKVKAKSVTTPFGGSASLFGGADFKTGAKSMMTFPPLGAAFGGATTASTTAKATPSPFGSAILEEGAAFSSATASVTPAFSFVSGAAAPAPVVAGTFGGLGAVTAAGAVDYRAELIKIWTVHAPEKLENVDKVLLKYKGKEAEMITKLKKKYKKITK